jgi:nonribosomal peptide synthetase DhbF
MAADYVALIRTVQREGPYNLLGWSLGGLVAHEMAVQLQGLGQVVSMLSLLDSYPFDPEKWLVGNELPREPERDAGLAGGVADNALSEMLETLRREGHLLSAIQEHDSAAITAAYRNNTRIMRMFSPKRFNGDMLLFVATRGKTGQLFESWTAHVAGRIDIAEIDCAHEDMMDPGPAAAIGRVLAAALDKQRSSLSTDGDDHD